MADPKSIDYVYGTFQAEIKKSIPMQCKYRRKGCGLLHSIILQTQQFHRYDR